MADLNEVKKSPAEAGGNGENTRPLEKTNYMLMGVSAFLIVLGFCLIGGAPTTEEAFNPDIFSTVRTAVTRHFRLSGL